MTPIPKPRVSGLTADGLIEKVQRRSFFDMENDRRVTFRVQRLAIRNPARESFQMYEIAEEIGATTKIHGGVWARDFDTVWATVIEAAADRRIYPIS